MVDRSKLPDRRYSETIAIDVELDGKPHHVLLTVGFDVETRQIREMFCASFKAGTGLNVLVMDACVLVSLLLQHGYTVHALRDTLADGPSMIGALLRAAAELEERKSDSPVRLVTREAES